jgi:hypothetical protein
LSNGGHSLHSDRPFQPSHNWQLMCFQPLQ